jgi:hypothetical protein
MRDCGCSCDSGEPARRGGVEDQFLRAWLEPTRSERKEFLEAFKKRLEERLAEVEEELRRL